MKQQPQSLRQKFINRVRVFNKYILNRVMLGVSKNGKGPYTVLRHIGRRSGQSYRTPVFASYAGETVIIPLPYGEQVDWLRNILAQGGCELTGNKSMMTAINPGLLGRAAGLALLPKTRSKIFRLFKIEKFLRLQIVKRRNI